ncbi:MAG: hypothetical protein ACFFD1_00890 [Candidatus Thorarchaeota archaeon]
MRKKCERCGEYYSMDYGYFDDDKICVICRDEKEEEEKKDIE